MRSLILLVVFTWLITSCSTLSKEQKTGKFLTQEDAVLRVQIVSNPSYQLDIQLDKDKADFIGVAKIQFTGLSTDKDLRLDFVGGSVSKVVVNQKEIITDYNNIFIKIPASHLKIGENSITVNYSHPYAKDGRGLNKTIDKEDGSIYTYTQFEPFDANRVFPCFDQPDLKATYTLKVKAPKEWEVISSQRETSKKLVDKNYRYWDFPKSQKFSTYIFSLHAGDYVKWEDKYKNIPLRLFARKTLAKYVKPKEWFGPTKIGFKFFPEYFKTAYPYSKYDQIIVPDMSFGAMENVGAVTFNEVFITRGKKTAEQLRSLDVTIFHEMAHMWFGNLVTMKWWNDLWLNESFATYVSNVALAKATKHKEKIWVSFNGTKEWAYWEDRLVTTHPILTPVENTDRAFTNFDGITYGKGASSLKQLVYYIGEENFRNGLAAYFKKFSTKNTKLKDFMGELSRASKMDLENWQKKWLETSGVNRVSVDYSCTNNKINKFTIEQTYAPEHPTLRPHKLQLAFMKKQDHKYVKTYQTHVVTIDSKSKHFDELTGQDCPDVVYANYQDYGYVNVQLDRNSTNFLQDNIQQIKDPLTSKMLWLDLWRMVRDGKYDVRSYGELILTKMEYLKDPQVFRNVFKINEVLFYLPKSTLEEKKFYTNYLNRAENQLWEKFNLLNKKSQNDLKKNIFYKMVKSFKSNSAQINLASLLYKKPKERGYSFLIDQDMRWQIIQNLARNGHPQAKTMIATEKKRDSSYKGLKMAMMAQASLPEWAIKEQWISEFKKPKSEHSLDILRSVAYNLFPDDQVDFRMKYGPQFFKDLKQVASSKDMVFASTFTSLSPKFCEKEDPDLISPFLNKQDSLAPMISKRLKVTRQESQRCRNIRNFARKN